VEWVGDRMVVDAPPAERPLLVGRIHGCAIDIVAMDLWSLKVDLAIACVRDREGASVLLDGLGAPFAGGFRQLRVAEVFRGRLGETLLLPGVTSIAAGGALLVGVGVRGSLASVRRAAHVAAMQVQRLGCRQVASDCDGALWHADRDASALMAAALVGIGGILEAEAGRTERWTFVCRTERIEHFVERFRFAFRQARAMMRSPGSWEQDWTQ
jgi:hypothetical protein